MMEELVALLQTIPPTFWGVVIGSLFTVIGVILTNASNTKRLRLQHAHERNLESQERDLSLRRETYMAAIEAISAGMVVVGRFGDTHVPAHDLMRAYTDRAPAVAKVPIVGNEETIQAVANFSQSLTGAFLRLTARREQLNALMQQSAALDAKIELARQEHAQAGLATLQAEQAEIEKQWVVAQMELVQKSIEETATLDRLLVPVIRLIRAELGLPFDEAFYARILEQSHQQLAAFLEEFIRELPPDFKTDTT